jgi:glycosyltransferase involved in cell wall biosynthesis
MPYHICHIEIAPIGGMPRVLRAADSAYASGNRVTVIGFGPSQEYHGYPYIGVRTPISRKDRVRNTSPEMVRLSCQTDADIVQLHSPELLLYVNSLKRAGKKVIFDSHEFYSLQIREKHYIPKPLRNMIASLYEAFETRALRRIDAVVYPCTVQGRDLFASRAKRAVKIENYSMPVEPALLPSGPADTRAVIHAGGLTEARGITTLAHAVSKTNAKLILCGPFSSPEYQQEILASCPSGQIEYMGTLNREDLFRQYGRSAIGVCTLRAVGQYALLDNMSTKVYEYMQCGLPVVVSNFPCYQYWNEKYHFGICVDPSNEDEIAVAIRYLLDHPDEARQMGENGRRAVKEEFNWGVEEKKLLALYEDIMK